MASGATPISGAPYPVLSDTPSEVQDFEAFARYVDSRYVPRFPSTSARDTAYTTWAGISGNTMVDGMCCTVSGALQVRRSGAWTPVDSVDIPWSALAIASGYTGLNNAGWRVVGNRVQLRGAIKLSSGTLSAGGPFTIAGGGVPIATTYGTALKIAAGMDTPIVGQINPRPSTMIGYTGAAGATTFYLDGISWEAS